ncbi:MAG: hypothetical protein JNM44_02725 [Chitinophagaceae bacterium]|nr:hypothetical protein [Chitinophagaceae bacterium]
MKKFLLSLMLLGSAMYSTAQTNISTRTEVIPCSDFHITRPLRELFANNPVEEEVPRKPEESADKKYRKSHDFKFSVADGPQYGNDPEIIQREGGSGPTKAPLTNWIGQNATGFRPYDPSGAAGPNHYVQMINSTTFKVYNKTTGTVTLTGTLGNLWSPATGNSGDPIVLYDKPADRWLLAQFGTSADKKIYIAISTSGDPTGSYYTYTYVSPAFPDYLKFSVWHDGYYMTSNQAQKVFAFERSQMLVGNPASRSIYVSYSPPQGGGFFCPLAGDASDGALPPAGTPCPIFSYSDNAWNAAYTDAVQIYNMSVDWTPTTPTGSITLAAAVNTSSFDASYNASWNDCPQPGTTQMLDGIGGTLMYRAQWKPWSGHNSVVLNWGVKLSATQRSIMWCELRQNQSTGTWSIYQQGIYAPDTNTRWMGSIAMDNNGCIGMAYLKSNSSSIYPSLCYTGRRECDPLGTLPIAEYVAAPGTGYQTGTNRIGDYAQTSLDPDGITFWHTGEFLGGPSGSTAARTQIFSWQIAPCGNNAYVNITQTGGNSPACVGETLTFTASPTNGGTTPSYQWKVNGVNVGTNSATYTTSSLTNGQVVTCVMTSNLAGVGNNPATSNAITVVVNNPTLPTISINASQTTFCAGTQVVFTATTTNAGASPVYQWKINGVNAGTNSATFTTNALTNGQTVTCVLTSSANCLSNNTATSNGITVNVSAAQTPTLSISASATTICSATSVTFTATATNPGINPSYQWKVNGSNVGTNSSTYTSSAINNGDVVTCQLTSYSTCPLTVTLGTGTGTNTTTSGAGAAYPTYYGNGRQQYIIRATELTALGLSTSGLLQSVGFNVATTNVGSPATLNGYTIKLANVSNTVSTTSFLNPTFTTVLGPLNYTPVTASLNTHTFTTPFVWDGISNVLVDICFSNQVVGTSAYQTAQTNPGFVTSVYYQADGTGGAGACTQATGITTSVRPNMTLKHAGVYNTVSNGITMTVGSSSAPSVSISTASTTACSGSTVTFTASALNAGSAPAYQWKINGNNVGSNSSTFSTTSLSNGQTVTCVVTSNNPCSTVPTATSNALVMTISSAITPSVSIVSSATTICAGASVTFTATPVNGGTPTYQWKVNGVNSGSNSPLFTTTTLNNNDVVTCEMNSTLSCLAVNPVTSNPITLQVGNVLPGINISTPSSTFCTGQSALFTATVSNAGANPVYQWKLNGANVGTNNASYSGSSFNNGDQINCSFSSDALCASTYTLGTGTTTTSATGNTNSVAGSVYPTSFGNARIQYLFTASELTTLGMSAGKIGSVTFSLMNAAGNPTTLNNYTLRMAPTTATVLTTSFQNPVFTTVYGPQNYTPINNALNTMNFSTPFEWDGVSNILLEICFNNNSTGVSAYRNYYTSTSFNSCAFYRVQGAATPCTQATASGFSTRRPNVQFNLLPRPTVQSNTITLNVNPCVSALNLTLFTEGYFDQSNTSKQVLFNQGIDPNPASTLVDTFEVRWHNSTAPYAVVHTEKGLLQTNGLLAVSFPSSLNGTSYYLSLHHRNTLETWSASPLNMASVVNYDFSNAASQAYGSNQTAVGSGSVFALFTGDINQDGVVDGLDFVEWETDNLNFSAGYFGTDFNGDGVVDGLDFIVWETNNLLFVGMITP